MAKKTNYTPIILIAALGAAAYFLFRKKGSKKFFEGAAKGVEMPDETELDISEPSLMEPPKKLKASVIVPPVEKITEEEFESMAPSELIKTAPRDTGGAIKATMPKLTLVKKAKALIPKMPKLQQAAPTGKKVVRMQKKAAKKAKKKVAGINDIPVFF